MTAPALPASTIIVLRPSGAAFDVLMVKRNDRVAFMAGAYVFPGGRVDDEDRARAAQQSDEWPSLPGRFDDLSAGEDLAYRVAAVRELLEEADVRVALQDLRPFAHWVTPEVEPRRYDTRFFLARMPEGQEARHDAGETTAFAWLTPAAAIEHSRRGEILLPPPTWTTLRRLARFSGLDEVFAWANRQRIVRIQPDLITDEGQMMLTLPGDPLHAAIPGWDVPEETRFVLEDGRWKAVRV